LRKTLCFVSDREKGKVLSDRTSIDTQAFLRTLRAVNFGTFEIAHKVFEEYGFPHPGMAIIGHVASAPGSTVSEVARCTGFAKSNVSNTVDVLVAQGFLEKRNDPRDQRLVRLYLTEEADKRLCEMKSIMDARLTEVLSVLPKDKFDCLLDALTILKDALEKQEMIQ